ncbi:MAG: CBS domain-containing protein [Prochlorotrichaceae cyanobacterium]
MSGTVSDFMSRELIRVTPETSVKTVIQTLADHHISGLPVVNGQNQLVGVISELDLLWQESGVTPPPYITLLDSIIYLQNPSSYDRELHKAIGQTAADVMTAKPITITQDQPLSEAARIMHDRRIHRLFVLNDRQELAGVITASDILRAMSRAQEGEHPIVAAE